MMHLYSADAARPLAERLAGVLARADTDPLAPEWLAVPSEGMRRWVTLELARHLGRTGPGRSDGIAANIERAFPGTLRTAVLSADRADGAPDPWGIERLVWPVLEALDTGVPGLPDSLRPGAGPLYGRARRIADLMDRYHLHRPRMIRYWSEGHDVDGTGRPLPEPALWQARLWRRVRGRLGEPSPPERLPGLLERLRRGENLIDLPHRLMLFGFTLLPAGDFLDIARAVAETRDVHLFLLEPTRLDPAGLLRCSPAPPDGAPRLRVNDPTAGLVGPPLLRSWGRLHRESALLVADAGLRAAPVDPPVNPRPSATLLGRLQQDIVGNVAPLPTLAVDPGDRSVQFHACFGATRQVEVLRDTLLHLLAEPGTDLTEDDIVVLCPSLERFAPLVEAVFGRSAASTTPAPGEGAGPGRPGAPALRYRIADRSMRSTNPVLSAASALLAMVAGRFDAATVLDFLGSEPVRERFGFDDDGLVVIADWVKATNVRWGIDPEHRTRLGLRASVVTNTWRAALDRLLIGSAVFDEEWTLAVGGVAPLGVEGDDVVLAGHLAEALGHLADLAVAATGTSPLADWVREFRTACTALFAAPRDQSWQMEALDRILSTVVESATVDGTASGIALEWADMVRLLEERLDDSYGRADFFRGGITVTSLTPLRWVPFRVVCLLGLDQAAFGSEGSAGDDLSAVQPQVGDRDQRGEVRQALLEAVLAAEDHLVVVRDGHDVRTNQVVPRAVATAELFEAVLAPVAPDSRARVADRLETDHPRHGYDERCFQPDGVVPGTVWSFDDRQRDGAEARRRRSHVAVPLLAEPLAAADTEVIDLADLHRFFTNPTAAFFSQRLEARLPRIEEELSSVLPLSIGGLEGWEVGTRLLEARMAGTPASEWLEYERALGTVPPGPLGDLALATLTDTVEGLVAEARHRGVVPGPALPFAVDVELPDGTRIVGSVPLRLPSASPGPVRQYYSRYKPTHRVAAWLDLMVLAVSEPDRPWRSLAISRSEGARGPMVNDLVVAPDGTDSPGPTRALAVAVDCFRRGLTEPLPLFPTFSHQIYKGRGGPSDWTGYKFPADGQHPAVELAFNRSDFDTIRRLPPRPGDPPGPNGRVFRFAAYLFRAVDSSVRPYQAGSGPKATGGSRRPGRVRGPV